MDVSTGVGALLDDFGAVNCLVTGEEVVFIVIDERLMLGQDFKTCCINSLQADSTISLLLLNVSSFELLSKLSSFEVFTIFQILKELYFLNFFLNSLSQKANTHYFNIIIINVVFLLRSVRQRSIWRHSVSK